MLAVLSSMGYFLCVTIFEKNISSFYVFVCFVALSPKSTAMVIAGWSVHLTTHFPLQA